MIPLMLGENSEFTTARIYNNRMENQGISYQLPLSTAHDALTEASWQYKASKLKFQLAKTSGISLPVLMTRFFRRYFHPPSFPQKNVRNEYLASKHHWNKVGDLKKDTNRFQPQFLVKKETWDIHIARSHQNLSSLLRPPNHGRRGQRMIYTCHGMKWKVLGPLVEGVVNPKYFF